MSEVDKNISLPSLYGYFLIDSLRNAEFVIVHQSVTSKTTLKILIISLTSSVNCKIISGYIYFLAV